MELNKTEELRVKQLGEQIGYGNMMHIASRLWRKMLKEEGTPGSGAFIPAATFQIKKKELKRIKKYNPDLFD